jgi:hypothetical protein
MGSAGERRNAEPRLGQHARDTIDMRRLATMRGAGQRKLCSGECVTVGGARLHQRQRLQRLHRRAREHRHGNLANGKDTRAVRIGDRDGPAMTAFHQAAPEHLDKNRVAHATASTNLGARFSRLAVTASA